MPYCPVVHAFSIVTLDSAYFYADKRKVSMEVSFEHLINQQSNSLLCCKPEVK